MATASTWRVMVQFTANNLTGPGFNSLMNSLTSAHNSSTKLQAALSALKVAGGSALIELGKTGVDVFTRSAEAAGNLQQQLVLIKQTLGSGGVNAGGMSLLAAQRNMLTTGSNQVLMSQTDIAGIQRRLLGAGISAHDITRTQNGRSIGAMVTYLAELEQQRRMGTPDETAGNLAGFLKGYSVSGTGASTSALDFFQRAQSVTNHFSSDYLKYGEQYAGLTARTLGISPQDFVAALALQARANINASTAGTNLNNLLIYGMVNPAAMQNITVSQRAHALANTGMLGHADPRIAHALMTGDVATFHKLGYNIDPSALSKNQREAYASYMLEQTANTGVRDYVKRDGFIGGMQAYMNAAYANEGRRMRGAGVTSNDLINKQFVGDIEAIFGIRGMREALTFFQQFAPASERGHIESAVEQVNQMKKQPKAEELIAGLRKTLQGQESMTGANMTDILIGLGGLDSNGKAIPGGPLDMVLKILTGLNTLLSAIARFGQNNPSAMAHIGTAIGILGAAGMVGGAALVGSGLIGLGGAALGSGSLGGAALRGIGGFLSHIPGFGTAPVTRAWIGGQMGRASNWIGGKASDAASWASHASGWHGYTNDLMVHPEDARRIAQFGRVAVPNPRWTTAAGYDLERSGLKAVGNWFTKITPYAVKFGTSLGSLALKFVDVVGWVMLAVDAFRFFSKHPDNIAAWIADVIKVFRDTLIPGFKEGIAAIGSWLFGYLRDLLTMLNPLNWHKGVDWVKQVYADIQKDLGPSVTAGKVAPKHADQSQGKSNHNGNNKVSFVHNIYLDGKQVAAAVSTHNLREAKRAFRGSSGGLGVPGISFSSTGLA